VHEVRAGADRAPVLLAHVIVDLDRRGVQSVVAVLEAPGDPVLLAGLRISIVGFEAASPQRMKPAVTAAQRASSPWHHAPDPRGSRQPVDLGLNPHDPTMGRHAEMIARALAGTIEPPIQAAAALIPNNVPSSSPMSRSSETVAWMHRQPPHGPVVSVEVVYGRLRRSDRPWRHRSGDARVTARA
jgi:hypothetical protein